VRQLPGEDGRILGVGDAVDRVRSLEQVRDPVLVSGFDPRVCEELVVLFEAEIHKVLVHASEVAPVVGEGEDQLESALSRFMEHEVETLEAVRTIVVDRTLALRVPRLKMHAVLAAFAVHIAYAAIERTSIEEGPGAKHREAERLRRRENIEGR